MAKQITLKEVVALKLRRLMQENEDLGTAAKAGKRSGVGKSTIDRATRAEANLTLETIEAMAKAYRVQPLDLLSDAAPTVLTDEETELIKAYRGASDAGRNIIKFAILAAQSHVND